MRIFTQGATFNVKYSRLLIAKVFNIRKFYQKV